MELLECLGCFLIYGSIPAIIIILVKSAKKDEKKPENKINEIRTEIINDIAWSLSAASWERHDKYFASYYDINTEIGKKIDSIRDHFSVMKKENDELVKKDGQKDRSLDILNREYELLNELRSIKEKYLAYCKMISAFPQKSRLVNSNSYGTVHPTFISNVKKLSRSSVTRYVSGCYKALSEKNIEEIYRIINPEALMYSLWSLAMDESFNSEMFEKAKKSFNIVYKDKHPDALLAEFYANRKTVTDAILQETIRNAFASEKLITQYSDYPITREEIKKANNDYLNTVASGLKWMGEYRAEKEILKYLAANDGLNEGAKARLNQLNRE